MPVIASGRAAIAQWLHSLSSGRALLWLLMAIAAVCYSAFLGAFSQSPVEVGLVVAGLAGLIMLILTGQGEQPPPWTFIVAAALCVLGPVVSTSTNFTGWFLFGVGSVVVVGRPQAPHLLGALSWGAGAILMVALQVGRHPNTATLLWNSVAVIGVLLLAVTRRQATIRRRQEAELVERSRQLEQRSLELIEQTERTRAETARAAALEERTRIARELHDLLAHALGGLVVQLDAAEAVLAAGGDHQQVAERLRSSRRLAAEGLQDARAAVRELRSDDQPATVSVADAVSAVINGPVGMQLGLTLDIAGVPRPIPYDSAQAFAAVAREAITNINKHAPGGRATASLIFGDTDVRLELINALADHGGEDDLARSGSGFGLDGLRRRMAEVGGSFRAGPEGARWVVTADWRESA